METSARMHVYTDALVLTCLHIQGMRSPRCATRLARLSATLDTHVSVRTTASAGDCTRPRSLGYLFDMSRHKAVSVICIHIDVAKVDGYIYIYIYKASQNYVFLFFLSLLQPRYFILNLN